jgi:hypothetical protein
MLETNRSTWSTTMMGMCLLESSFESCGATLPPSHPSCELLHRKAGVFRRAEPHGVRFTCSTKDTGNFVDPQLGFVNCLYLKALIFWYNGSQ